MCYEKNYQNKEKENIMKKKILSVFLATAMVAAMAAGCGSVKTDNEVSASESGEKAAGKDVYSEEVKIAFLPNVIGDSVAAAWADGMETYLSEFKNVTFDVYDGEASVDTEVQIMDELINQEYDAIILQATDAAGLASSVDKAEGAGIPVITVNMDADTTHTGMVTMVDVEAGEKVAEAIGESLGGEGEVVIISATPGASKGEQLDKGFKSVMEKKYPNIEILDEQSGEWLTENANTVMTNFLTKYPEIDAVFCHNDAMAEGAAEAAKAAGKDIQIWGCDGETKMLEYIEQGLCTGTIYTDVKNQGAVSAQFAMYAINSGITGANLSETPIVKMSSITVTGENVGQISENMRW